MAGYIGTQAVSVNTTSATISDDLSVGDDATIAGTLGINTTSPSNDVEIITSADAKGLTIKNAGNVRPYLNFDSNRTGAGNTLSQLNFKWDGTDVARINAIAGADTTNKDDGVLVFFTAAAGSPTEAMRIASNSNVGIDTTAPQRALSIGTHGTTSAAEVAFGSTTTGTASLLFGDSTSGTALYSGYVQYQHNGDYMLLAAGAAERLRVTSNAGANVVVADGLTLSNGDLIVATGHGINFAATGNISGTSSELLDDYEEGNVSLKMKGGNGDPNTQVNVTGTYVKIGRLVSLRAQNLNLNNTGAVGPMYFEGLPFAANGAYGIGSIGEVNDICSFTNQPFLVCSGLLAYVFQNITQANSSAVNHHVDTAGAINLEVTYETNS